MTEAVANRPAEIFGYPLANQSAQAQQVRGQHLCPFRNVPCDKKSRLLDVPFGVCSVQARAGTQVICPRRFDEGGNLAGVPRVLEDVAMHYFGDTNNIVVFAETRMPNVGNIDFVIVKHRAMRPEIDDFVAVEIQADSTTGTGELVRAFQEFTSDGHMADRHYRFGANTYDSIKRAVTQLMNKGMVYEKWRTKCYWVIQEYIYANLASRFGLAEGRYRAEDSTRFALYSLAPRGERLALEATRVLSTNVDDVYQAMRNNPGIPTKDAFVRALNHKLQLRLAAVRPSRRNQR